MHRGLSYLRCHTLLEQANELNCASNQRLEFLGDAILEVVVLEYLYRTGVSTGVVSRNPSLSPGVMSELKSAVLCNHMLAALACRAGFAPFLIHSQDSAAKDRMTTFTKWVRALCRPPDNKLDS